MKEVLVTTTCFIVWAGCMYVARTAAHKATLARSKHVLANEPLPHNWRTKREAFWRLFWLRVWVGAAVLSCIGAIANIWAWWWRDGYAGLVIAGVLGLVFAVLFTKMTKAARACYKAGCAWDAKK